MITRILPDTSLGKEIKTFQEVYPGLENVCGIFTLQICEERMIGSIDTSSGFGDWNEAKHRDN